MRASVLHITVSIPACSPRALTTASRRMCAHAAETAATATFPDSSAEFSYTSTHTPLNPSPSLFTSLYTVVAPSPFPSATPQSRRMRYAAAILSAMTRSTSQSTAATADPGLSTIRHSHAMRSTRTAY